MSAFLIIDITILNVEAMEEYERNVLPLLAKFDGKPIAYDDDGLVLEGAWNNRVVIVEFPSKEAAWARRNPMDGDVKLLEQLYDRFNARDIEAVLAALTDDVAWANGMDGGHVHGRDAVRDYWTRQWAIVSPHVEPVGFHRTPDGAIVAEVRQTIRDLEGRPLQDQTHGLKDKTVGHVFRLRDGKVARFDIRDAG